MIYGRGVGSVTTLKTFQTWKTDGSSDVDTFIKNQIFGSEFYYSNGFIRADGPLGMMLFLLLSICFIFFFVGTQIVCQKNYKAQVSQSYIIYLFGCTFSMSCTVYTTEMALAKLFMEIIFPMSHLP